MKIYVWLQAGVGITAFLLNPEKTKLFLMGTRQLLPEDFRVTLLGK